MEQTATITHLKGLADHACLSHAHWLRSARQGGSGNYGPAYCIEGAGIWRRRLGELLAQMILYRRGMGSVEVVNPSGGGSHAAFARRALEAAAVGAGLTYGQVSGDLAQANYSSLRAGKIEFRRLCEQVQYGMLIPMLVRPIAHRFHAQGALLGLWGADMPDGVSHVPPAHEMIDPLKDTTALIAQVRAGFVPQPEAAGAFGYDFRAAVEIAATGAATPPRAETTPGAPA